MTPAEHWIRRAADMYEVARRMARVMTDPDLPPRVRERARVQCESAIETAAGFEDLALRRMERWR